MRRIAALGVAAGLLAGCGGGGGGSSDAKSALSATAAKLGTIRSGSIVFDLRVSPTGGAGKTPFGFRVAGPFALAAGGRLPRADVHYTQRANGQSATVDLISTGRAAFVTVGGKTYALPADRAAPLLAASTALSDSSGGIRQVSLA